MIWNVYPGYGFSVPSRFRNIDENIYCNWMQYGRAEWMFNVFPVLHHESRCQKSGSRIRNTGHSYWDTDSG